MTVDPLSAGRILDRLKAHYPRLADNDQASKDWLNEICLTPDPAPIAQWMIEEWDEQRTPRLSDWVKARRTSVHQAIVAAPDALPIEAPVVRREVVREKLDEAARLLAANRLEETRAKLVDHGRGWSGLRYPDGGGGLAVRPLTYEETYDEDGNPRVRGEDG